MKKSSTVPAIDPSRSPKHYSILLLDLKAKPHFTNEEREAFISERFREILWALGLDLNDESLKDTPDRVARMYVRELFSGLDPAHFPKVSFFEDKGGMGGMVVVKAGFMSTCEHHFLPMQGTAHVAYLPKGKVIGLSKIPRIVEYFSKRPQLQERLTADIANTLVRLLGTEDVAVLLEGEHFCVKARGVEDPHGSARTHVLLGRFKTDREVREEFFLALKHSTC